MTAENYLVNGRKLDDPASGWRLLAATLPRTAQTMRKTSSTFAGRDGFQSAASTRSGIVPQFEVMVPESDWETLLALFQAPALTITREGVAGRAMYGELKSSSSPKDYPRSGMVSAMFYVDVPEGCWRGTTATTSLTAAAAGGAPLTLFAGLSAPVQDALVRVRGPITDPEVTDTAGSFFALDGALTGSEYLRFDSATGRAWVTSADTWTGGTEVSGHLDFGGPRGVFEMTPRFPNAANPAGRECRLTLRQATFASGAGFQVRGQASYLI